MNLPAEAEYTKTELSFNGKDCACLYMTPSTDTSVLCTVCFEGILWILFSGKINVALAIAI